jgi:hypothetical protein
VKSIERTDKTKFVLPKASPLSSGAAAILSIIHARRKDFARFDLSNGLNNQPLPKRGFSMQQKLTEGLR